MTIIGDLLVALVPAKELANSVATNARPEENKKKGLTPLPKEVFDGIMGKN
jgi:hypothetical protein